MAALRKPAQRPRHPGSESPGVRWLVGLLLTVVFGPPEAAAQPGAAFVPPSLSASSPSGSGPHPRSAAASPSAPFFPSPELTRLCQETARRPARDRRIRGVVEQALQQHALFGGQWIDRRGALAGVGFYEAENGRPHNSGLPTWQRVAAYWQALGPGLPATFRAPDGSLVDIAALRQQVVRASPGAAPATHASAPNGATTDELPARAIESAMLRAALVDQPWSAALLSFLFRQQGFSAVEFAFSASHADYVDRAVLAGAAEARGEGPAAAYRACDIGRTAPRAGDIVCHTRADASTVRTLAGLQERLALRRAQPLGNGLPMHCDPMTRADQGGDAKLEAVGGNLVQSVSLRRMRLNARKTLSSQHFAPAQEPPCGRQLCATNLNRQPWVVLLQARH